MADITVGDWVTESLTTLVIQLFSYIYFFYNGYIGNLLWSSSIPIHQTCYVYDYEVLKQIVVPRQRYGWQRSRIQGPVVGHPAISPHNELYFKWIVFKTSKSHNALYCICTLTREWGYRELCETKCWYLHVLLDLSQGTDITQLLQVMKP